MLDKTKSGFAYFYVKKYPDMSRSGRRDLLILAGIICFFLSVYFYSDSVLAMHTDKHQPVVLISLGVACIVFTCYLMHRYLRERNQKLLKSLAASFGPACFLWALIAFNYNKVPLLIGYWRTTPTHTTIPLLDVTKRKYKGSFNGGRVKTVLERDTLFLDCSRTMYFALKGKSSVAADFGRSIDGRNWYISKVYIGDEAYSTARSAYWQDWRHRRTPLLLGLGILLAGGAVLFKLDEAGIIRLKKTRESQAQYEKPGTKQALLLFLLIFGLTFIGLLLWILYVVLTHR